MNVLARAFEVGRAVVVAIVAAPGVFAQEPPELVVSGPDPAVVPVGARAVLTIRAPFAGDGVRPELAPLPVVDGLSIVAGVRADRDDGSTWRLELAPERVGAFTIPPLLVSSAVPGSEPSATPVLALRAVRDEQGERHAFLAIETAARETVWIGEAVELRLRLGVDRTFFAANAVELFQRRLDLPVQIRARWLDGIDGVELLGGDDVENGQRLVVEDRVVAARAAASDERDGRVFDVVEIVRRVRPIRAGELAVPGAMLRYAYATEFRDDFLNGRVPVDRHEAFVWAPGIVVSVAEPPTGGRPRGYTGAVGQFEIAGSTDLDEVEFGGAVRLELTIRGTGNLDALVPPQLDALEGFHVQGVLELEAPAVAARRFRYDLVVVADDVEAVPVVELPFFDPSDGPGRYRIARTDPVPLRVLPRAARDDYTAATSAAPGRTATEVEEVYGPWGREPRAVSAPVGALELLAWTVAPWLAAVVAWFWLRRRERDRRDPAGVRARRAAAAFRRSIVGARTGRVVTDALVEYVAARLRVLPPAVITPGLDHQLVEVGVPKPLAERTASAVRAAVGSRFAGGPGDDAVEPGRVETVRSLVEELEVAFAPGRDASSSGGAR